MTTRFKLTKDAIKGEWPHFNPESIADGEAVIGMLVSLLVAHGHKDGVQFDFGGEWERYQRRTGKQYAYSVSEMARAIVEGRTVHVFANANGGVTVQQ